MTGVCLAVSGLRWSTLIKLGRLVRVVQGAFPKVSVGVEERCVLVERAAFLIGFVHHVTDSLVTGVRDLSHVTYFI